MSFWNGTEWDAPPSAAPTRPSRARHIIEATAEGTLIALLVVGLVAGTTLAGRPGGAASTGGFSVADGSFAQTTTAIRGSSSAHWVRARCYQGGTLDLRAVRGLWLLDVGDPVARADARVVIGWRDMQG